jgi:hypothetical protein
MGNKLYLLLIFIFFIFLIPVIFNINYNLNNQNNDWYSVIKKYQDNLTSTDSIELRMNRYMSILSDDPILLVNFKNISEAPNKNGEVPKPRILRGKEEIKKFQKASYENNKWTKLRYEVVQDNVGSNQGYVVLLGTHIVYKKGKIEPIYVQALEMFGLVKENNQWKLGTASFIDFIWSKPKNGTSKAIQTP